MCDVILAMPDSTRNGKILFGKNSDRPAGECQVLHYARGGYRERGCEVKCSYVAIPEVSHVHSTFGCRPYWCWGYETGMNEAGVAGGNTAVFTRSLWSPENRETPGLTGMELLRLGLERGGTAKEAVGVITELLEKYGQWGSAIQGKGHEEGSYENSFLLADRKEAWILETTGKRWVAESMEEGVRSISNELTIRNRWTIGSEDIGEFAREQGWRKDGEKFDFALSYSDHEHYARQVSHIRFMRSSQLLQRHAGDIDAETMMEILRDHYEDTFLKGPQFHPFLPDFHTLCMHESPAGFTWGNTATSMIVEIDPEDMFPPHCWVCYLPPCTGIFLLFHLSVPLPEIVANAGSAGLSVQPAPGAQADEFAESSLWWRFNRILEETKKDPPERREELRMLFEPIEKRSLHLVADILKNPAATRQQEFSTLVMNQMENVTTALDLIEKNWCITGSCPAKGKEEA